MDTSIQLDLGIAYHLALGEMRAGRGSEEHWSTIVCALNIALVLSEHSNQREADVAVVNGALDSAVAARDAAQIFNIWQFDEDQGRKIADAILLHDEQMSRISRRTLKAAMDEMHRRLASQSQG
ncbi:hypothetical protein [Paraburkholderia sp. BCC1886]|uniref:hypothetical protein n=1 Tax=Paraburkholderia sp. BCC1886 TaxID=2562670 RepID=UPI0011833A47|nr:hypothetical protein [Paraburkholderia sp. BCC1886]